MENVKFIGKCNDTRTIIKSWCLYSKTKEELIARLLVGQIVLVFTKYRNQWIPCFLEKHTSSLSNISKMKFKIPTYSEFVVWKFIYGAANPHTATNYIYNGKDILYKRVLLYKITPDQCRQLTIY